MARFDNARLDQVLQEIGLPPRDDYSLPSSSQTFSDGGHFRIEIAGVERLSALETLLTEAEAHNVPVHRIIATVGGATFLPQSELREFAALARERHLEVIITAGPRRAWDSGRQFVTSEGYVSGMRLRGQDQLRHWLKDCDRCLDAGFRGFLVPDEGLLMAVNQLREKGVLPAETIFKLSVFAGHANAAGAKLAQQLGANSFNPLADLTLPMFASIRQAIDIPMDVYLSLVNAMGGFVRFYEAAELARICSPCYFKIEPGPSEEIVYAPWYTPAEHDNQIRQRVRNAAVVMELIEREKAEVRCSPTGGEDLVIPR